MLLPSATLFSFAVWVTSYPSLVRGLPSAQPPGIIQFTLDRQPKTDGPGNLGQESGQDGRAGIDNLPLYKPEYVYFVNFSVGTPPQKVSAFIDTGSSDLLLSSKNTTYCPEQDRGSCYSLNGYQKKLSTSHDPGVESGPLNFSFGTSTTRVQVQPESDVVAIGGALLQNQVFFVGDTLEAGVLGLSYQEDGQAVNIGSPTLLQNLKKAGTIQALAFSVYLNDITSAGAITFGGIDTEKFIAPLTILPIRNPGLFSGKSKSLFSIDLTYLSSVTNTDKHTTTFLARNISVILDTGSTATVLPPDVFSTVANHFNASYVNTSDPFPRIPCSELNSNENFTFGLGGTSGTTISAPVKGFVKGPVNSEGSLDEGGYCLLAIIPTNGRTFVLGTDFLRSAYAVFDLENDQLGIAQSKLKVATSVFRQITPEGGINGP